MDQLSPQDAQLAVRMDQLSPQDAQFLYLGSLEKVLGF
jgi:hypothetical protein